MGKLGKSFLPQLELYKLAGIDPKSGLPSRVVGKGGPADMSLVINSRRLFRIIDEQRAVNRYQWYNLPVGLSSQELERLLYYRYTLCFFYFKELEQFFFMPYALDGTIDFYGRFNTIHPVPMTSGAEREEQSKEYKQKAALLSTKKLNVVKDVVINLEEITEDLLTNSAVIIRDYTNQMGQMGEARWSLNDHLLNMEAECLPFVRTNLIISTGIQALRVQDADSGAFESNALAVQLYNSAITGNPYVAVTAKAEFQDLQPTSLAKSSEYFLAMQSIDNLLLSTYGIDNTGIYEKKSHILESENAVNATNVSLVLADGLRQRQNFCNIVNSIWGLSIWCEVSEELLGYDADGDGVNYEEANDGAGSSYSTDEGGDE